MSRRFSNHPLLRRKVVWTNSEFEDFGEISFRSSKKISLYVRVENTTEPKRLYQHLTQAWKMKVPSIIISVTGGAKDFKMRSRLTREFQKSLIKAAESTGAWIVTGGKHCGVMKLVGDAVHKYNSSKTQQVVALGIPVWGKVTGNKDMKNCNKQSNEVVDYKHNVSDALDPNHSHFILVDDGTESYGGEIELRAQLEGYIAEKLKSKVVCVLVQGGYGSLQTASNAVRCNTPVVVINGSGGWANVLADLYSQDLKNVVEEDLSDILKKHNVRSPKAEQMVECTKLVQDCMLQKQLFTVFNLETPDGIADLDVSILLSILKAQSNKDQTEENLRLALAWNRADIADTEILTHGLNIGNETLAEIVVEAITQEKPDFVKLMLDCGVPDLCENIAKEKLIELYKETTTCMKMKIEEEQDVLNLKESFIGSFYKPNSKSLRDAFQVWNNESVLRELFFYCIFFNKKECARLLWESMIEHSVSAAIVATRMLQKLSEDTNSTDEKEDLLSHSEEYKDLSYGILTECFNNNKEKTMLFLRRRLQILGDLTNLQIIVDSKDINLASHPAIQYFLDQVWHGSIDSTKHLSKNSFWKSLSIYISAFTVFMIPLLFNFKANSENPINCRTIKQKGLKILWTIIGFYDAPVVKFHLTILFHLLFLSLFGYILLYNFFERINNFEILLLAWICTFVIEETRQMHKSPVEHAWKKFIHWWDQLGNKLDAISFVLYFIGFGLRFTIYMDTARVLLCFSFVIFCLRILNMFTVNKELGPKLLMVKEMLRDLFFFIFILLVFLIAYGVFSQSLLYPNERDPGLVFAGVISKPYWSIFGEIFLSETEYNPSTDEFPCTNNRTLIDQGHRRCPVQNQVVPVIAALYLLLANALLLNLLIAMFSYTFDKFIDKTDRIWKHQRFFIIEEYYSRPILVVPFSFLPFFFGLVFRKNIVTNHSFEVTITNDYDLVLWEQTNIEHYLDSEKKKKKESISFRIDSINESLDTMMNVITNLQFNFSKSNQ